MTSALHIRLLGTAAAEGWPALFCRCQHCVRARAAGGRNLRSRSAATVDGRFQFDFGPDSYHQVLSGGSDLSAIEHLIMTHSHSDHLNIGDLEMRHPPFAHGQAAPLVIYGNDRVISRLRARFADPGRVGLQLVELVAGQELAVGDATLLPLLADHDKAEACLIHVLGRGGRFLLYGHDSGVFPEPSWSVLEAWAQAGRVLDVVLLDGTNGPLAGRRNHMGLPACAEVRERLVQIGAAGPQTRFVATHFSHNGGCLHEELVAAGEPLGLEIAYDGMELVTP